MTRIVAWNIRAGGGKRIEWIAEQLREWKADVVSLCEFRATPASLWLQEFLDGQGLPHQLTTADPNHHALNRLLVASRWPIKGLPSHPSPEPQGLWLSAQIRSPLPFIINALHIPTFAFAGTSKYAFHNAVLGIVRHWTNGPALIAGDTNTGCIGIDEESRVFSKQSDDWMKGLDELGWRDAYRAFHGSRRCYTWYSPNAGNGFRLDQGFVNKELLSRLVGARYEWASRPDSTRRDGVSDHAALLVDLSD